MDETSTTALPSVRTFARDLERERKKRGLTAPTVSPVPPQPTDVSASAPTPPKPVPHITAEPAVVAAPTVAVTTPLPRPVLPPRPPIQAPPSTPRPAPTTVLPDEPKPIPPFHALSKEFGGARTITHQPKNIGSGIVIENDESGATVITDTKHDRFKLGPRIFASIRAWWKARQEARALRKAPKYVIPEAGRRQGIIQRATSHSGRVVTSDSAELREQVLRRNATAPTPPSAPAEPTTTWSANTESIFPLLEAPDVPTITNVQVTPRTRSTLAPEPRPVPPPEPAPAPKPVATPAPTPQAVDLSNAPPQLQPEETPRAEIATPPVREPRRFRPAPEVSIWSRLLNTNVISFTIVLAAVIVFAGMSISRWYLASTPAPTAPMTFGSVLINAPTLVVDLPTTERTSLIQALQPEDTESLTLPATEIFFTRGGQAISPALLLTLLDPAVDQNLAQSVRTMVFGWYEKTRPFMVLRVTDRTTALGGLLKWEGSLDTELSPFFTNSHVAVDTPFIDRTVAGYDLRMKHDTTNAEVLVYGFVNDQTIVIAPDQATFLSIAALATTPK